MVKKLKRIYQKETRGNRTLQHVLGIVNYGRNYGRTDLVPSIRVKAPLPLQPAPPPPAHGWHWNGWRAFGAMWTFEASPEV